MLSEEQKAAILDDVYQEVKQKGIEKSATVSVYTLEGWLSTVERHLDCCETRTEKIEHLQDMIKKCRSIVIDMQRG